MTSSWHKFADRKVNDSGRNTLPCHGAVNQIYPTPEPVARGLGFTVLLRYAPS
jgi:hypothetical protein